MAVIYKIEHRQTARKYIGKAKNVKRRWWEHLNNAKNGRQHPLYDAIRKYGQDAFTFEVLEEVLEQNVDQREIDLIREYSTVYPTGYNLTEGGEGGNTRKGMSEEQEIEYSAKLSKAAKQKTLQGTGICAKSVKGKHITETCPEIADKWRVNHKAATDRTTQRRREGNFTQKELAAYSHLSNVRKGGNNPRAAKIECVETGNVFGSMSEAVQYYRLNSNTPIRTTIKTGKPSTTEAIRGLTFKYYNER